MLKTFLSWDVNTTIALISLFISVIGSIAIPVTIWVIDDCHQKKLKEINEKKHKEELELEANKFIFEHKDEIKYLPLCFIISNLNIEDYHVYNRNVFNDFKLCREELKVEILRQRGINKKIPTNPEWINKALALFEKDLDKYRLKANANWFYKGYVYFYSGYLELKKTKWMDLENSYIFDRLLKNQIILMKKSNFSSYVEDYLYLKEQGQTVDGCEPLDVLYSLIDFPSCMEDEIIVAWTLELITAICCNLKNKLDKPNKNSIFYESEMVETFEDAFIIALIELYDCYYDDITKGK